MLLGAFDLRRVGLRLSGCIWNADSLSRVNTTMTRLRCHPPPQVGTNKLQSISLQSATDRVRAKKKKRATHCSLIAMIIHVAPEKERVQEKAIERGSARETARECDN